MDVEKMSEREMRYEIRGLRSLLVLAKCPNDDCIRGILMGRLAENRTQCEWCDERKAMLAEGG